MLDDILKTAQLDWNDINVVWAADLTASTNCPAEIFKRDPTVDACFVITPDMIALCGGLKNTGTGAEGTVKGARVVISTVDLGRSIADIYVCRKDFYEANKPLVTKFVAGYLKACEDIVRMRDDFENKKISSENKATYLRTLRLAQDIYTTNVINKIEEDGHGLLMDATFVGYPGNWKFFKWGTGYLVGFEKFVEKNLDLAVSRGYARDRVPLIAPDFDFTAESFTRNLKDTTRPPNPLNDTKIAEAISDDVFKKNAGEPIISFNINFDPGGFEFNERKYGDRFKNIVETSAKLPHTIFLIRGHADTTLVLNKLVEAGTKKGVLEIDRENNKKVYTFKGQRLDIASIQAVTNAIATGEFEGVAGADPRETMLACESLSLERAEAIKAAIIDYAKKGNLILDARRFKTEGVGIREPVVSKPTGMSDVLKNTRAQFNLVPVQAEVLEQSGRSPFDL
jgi:outer membrane protein OmpA-like peptidoglycan-associated protein